MGTKRIHDRENGRLIAPPPPTNAAAVAEVFSMLLGRVELSQECGLAQRLLFNVQAAAGVEAAREMAEYISLLCPRLRGPLAIAMRDRLAVVQARPNCTITNPPKEF